MAFGRGDAGIDVALMIKGWVENWKEMVSAGVDDNETLRGEREKRLAPGKAALPGSTPIT